MARSPKDPLRRLKDKSGRLKYAPSGEVLRAMPDGEPPDDLIGVDDPRPSWTVNQLVAFNLQRARRSRGWTQEMLGLALERYTGRRWSNAVVSAAERSWETERVRKFDANDLVAFAAVFKVPVDYFLLPPDDGREVSLRTSSPGDSYPYEDGSWRSMEISELLELLDLTQAPNDFIDRLDQAIREHLGREFATTGASLAQEHSRLVGDDGEEGEADEDGEGLPAGRMFGAAELPEVLRLAANYLEALDAKKKEDLGDEHEGIDVSTLRVQGPEDR